MRWRSRPERHDTGAVVAEFAVALPAIVLVLACCLGAVRVGVEQLRLSDAAAGAARVLGRGDPVSFAAAIVRSHSAGRLASITREGGFVCATAEGALRLGPLEPLLLTERACALDDPA